MLEMATLERAEPESDTPAKRHQWGAKQKLFLLGTVIGLFTGVPAIYLFFKQPPPPNREMSPRELRRQVEVLSPVHSLQLYRSLRRQGPQRPPSPQAAVHAESLLRHRIYAGTLLLVACVGIGLIVVAATKTNWKRASGP